MKRDKIIYWIATGIVGAIMVLSAVNFSLEKPMFGTPDGFAHLHLPEYFKKELTLAKLLGAVALLVPAVPFKIKEFAYAGTAITFVSASFAHYSSGDGIMYIIDPLIFFCVLSVSYICLNRIRSRAMAY